MDRDNIINQIQDYDILIQSYGEQDNAKTTKELKQLSDSDLKELLETRKAVLEFLIKTEDDHPDELLN